MADDVLLPPAPPALGPGDDDPRSPEGLAAAPAPPPLGPGDDDPRSPAVVGAPVVPAPGPGDLVGTDTTAGVVLLAPPPPAPGATPVARSIVRIPVPAGTQDEVLR